MRFVLHLRQFALHLIALSASAVLSTLPSSTIALVMPLTVPVKDGLAKGVFDANAVSTSVFVYVVDWLAFASKAVCVRLEIGLLASDELSRLPSPTIDLVIPLTVPVKVGLSLGAFKLRADCVALDIGLLALAALSTLPSPTIDFVMPCTVPVKIGSNLSAFYQLLYQMPLRWW